MSGVIQTYLYCSGRKLELYNDGRYGGASLRFSPVDIGIL
jgi:hypothetical protein